jgi:uncharacterized membrane protein YedE/YeeE
MNEFAPLSGLVGGLMLGVAASALVLLSGRVAGISGIVAGSFRARGIELGWRAAFVLGLVLGPLVVAFVGGAPVARLGGGCTSGHGVCGISRLSPRSLVATAVFIVAGMAVVFVVRHVLGLPTWP